MKFKRAELVEDGYLHKVLVCSSCFDEDHPQRYPPPIRIEGEPPLRPAPENLPKPTTPVLSGFVSLDIHLSWTASTTNVSYITGYTLYRSVDGGTYAELFESENVYDAFRALVSDVRATEDDDVTITHSYAYYVVAHAAQGGDSDPSNIVTFQFEQATAPVLTSQIVTDHVQLDWTEAVIEGSTIDHYEVFRDDGGGFELIGETDPDVLTLNDFDLHAGGEYDYYVIAVPVNALDSQSNTVHESVAAVAPSVVTLSVNMSSCSGPSLSWTVSTTDPPPINSYAIWRSTNGGAFALIHTTDGVTLAYQDTSVTKPNLYDYYVIAHSNTNGDSGPSNTVAGDYPATEEILASETWTNPNSCWTSIDVISQGDGGGGASGSIGSGERSRRGGMGGGGGGYSTANILLASITGPVAVVVGQGGAGGPQTTIFNTNGTDGDDGLGVSFGAFCVAGGGKGGRRGAVAGGGSPPPGGGEGGVGTVATGGAGGRGGAATDSPALVGGNSTLGGGGGGGGAGHDSGFNYGAPSVGGNGNTAGTPNVGGAIGACDNLGSPGASDLTTGGGGGGGGGAGCPGITSNGQAGGNGGTLGGGGAGGGAATNQTGGHSGAGGHGGRGNIQITYNY